LHEDPSDFRIQGHDISDFVSIFSGGSFDEIVSIDGFRIVVFVDVLIELLEVVVENLFISVLIQFIKELIQFREDKFLIVLLDDGEEIFLTVFLLLEFEDAADVLNERQLPTVQLPLQLEQDSPRFTTHPLQSLYIHTY
jgi:hypothetical protein